MTAKRTLTQFRAPDELGAEERAWTVVRTAYADAAWPVRDHSRRRVALLAGVALVVGALVLSPAGASVRRWISQRFGAPHAAPSLLSLPAPGTLLVSGGGGTWTVADRGQSRRLGGWQQAAFSPHGEFVAVVGRDQLAAVDPHGTVRWTLARPEVRDPSWFSPSGLRVAYLTRHDLRVVAGDGTGDHLLAAAVAAVAPAWEPGHAFRLAYVGSGGRVVVRDGDTGAVAWSAAPASRPVALSWAADGRELLVAARDRTWIYGQGGRLLGAFGVAGAPILDAALSPNGRMLALISGAASQDVEVVRVPGGRSSARRVLSGQGLRTLVWSPNGSWLVVSWPLADQWVFVRVGATPRILAVSHIGRQFGRGPAGRFPDVDGWCCTAAQALTP